MLHVKISFFLISNKTTNKQQVPKNMSFLFFHHLQQECNQTILACSARTTTWQETQNYQGKGEWVMTCYGRAIQSPRTSPLVYSRRQDGHPSCLLRGNSQIIRAFAFQETLAELGEICWVFVCIPWGCALGRFFCVWS